MFTKIQVGDNKMVKNRRFFVSILMIAKIQVDDRKMVKRTLF